MNAQVRSRLAPQSEVSSAAVLGAPSCPVAEIGVRLERALADCSALEAKAVSGREYEIEDRQKELFDLSRVLRDQLAWRKATSLRGVFYQFVELTRTVDAFEAATDPAGKEAAARAKDRLSALIYASLRDIGGVDDLARDFTYGLEILDDGGAFADVLQQQVGDDIVGEFEITTRLPSAAAAEKPRRGGRPDRAYR